MTWHNRPRLSIAFLDPTRFKDKVREKLRGNRRHNLRRQIKELLPVLCGRVNYFRLTKVEGVFEALDSWLRRILWHQWERPHTRVKTLMKRDLREEKAWILANRHGPW